MYDKGLKAFLFGVHVNDEGGLAVFDGSKDDGASLIDHRAKIERENRENCENVRTVRRENR